VIQSIGLQPPKATEIKKAIQIAADVLNVLSDLETENAHTEQICLLAQALVQLSEARTLVHAELKSLNEAKADRCLWSAKM
jgi:hypothetical protein